MKLKGISFFMFMIAFSIERVRINVRESEFLFDLRWLVKGNGKKCAILRIGACKLSFVLEF